MGKQIITNLRSNISLSGLTVGVVSLVSQMNAMWSYEKERSHSLSNCTNLRAIHIGSQEITTGVCDVTLFRVDLYLATTLLYGA